MNLYRILKFIYPSLVWNIKTKEKVLYLTFDDGPVPEITPWVLEQLDRYNAKATFFCIGDNVVKHPDIYKKLAASGHVTGNHTYNHLNAFKTSFGIYLDNVSQAKKIIDSNLFRPPYGKITSSLILNLKKNYKIIMWDVLSCDYRQDYSGEKCFNIVKRNSAKGSIIVFHDSVKAAERLQYVLPKVLEYFTGEGYKFETIKV